MSPVESRMVEGNNARQDHAGGARLPVRNMCVRAGSRFFQDQVADVQGPRTPKIRGMLPKTMN